MGQKTSILLSALMSENTRTLWYPLLFPASFNCALCKEEEMRRKEGMQILLGGRVLRQEERGGAEYLFLLPSLNSTFGFEFSLPFPLCFLISPACGQPYLLPSTGQRYIQKCSSTHWVPDYARKSGSSLQLCPCTYLWKSYSVVKEQKLPHEKL